MMNDAEIKSFAVWARTQLLDDVQLQMRRWAIGEQATVPADADTLNGEILTPLQRRQRAELLRLCKSEGAARLAERAAYTWFNRFLAIRFMELHDYLPCGMRFFSAPDGSFQPQVLREALHADIEGVDRLRVAELVNAGDDEALFRYLFIAQCNELAESMPAVFEKVGSAMELLLPQALLREGSVIQRMVADIPEEDWLEGDEEDGGGVEIVGWMYQYYVSERKDEVFASFKKGKKAERDAIAPATQLFTPKWIVHYLVENSLGRLWMLNHPDSHVVDHMKYYISPDENDHEDFKRISSLEEITVCDPACGSGHILVYAFDLLALMYEEAGYVKRDIPSLILEKNLSGMEIDPRAAALASFVLTMKARKLDSRFLRRGVSPDIFILEPAELTDEERDLVPAVASRKSLVDAMRHLDECGSLFAPEEGDASVLQEALRELEGSNSLFADSARSKIKKMLNACESLSRVFDVVVANPPYMGSSNMSKWLANWTKKHCPDSKRDLCTCFIERGFSLAQHNGYLSLVTMQSWMFLGSFEQLRSKMVDDKSIVSMMHIGARGFDSIGGEVVSTTATVLLNEPGNFKGSYIRLVDDNGEKAKSSKALEAIANPDCGWFYRHNAQNFKSIPGNPIAYWASEAVRDAFLHNEPLNSYAVPHIGIQTGDNDRLIKSWWEVSCSRISFNSTTSLEAKRTLRTWFPIWKGGSYRKWSGNREEVVNWYDDGSITIGEAGKDGRRVMDLPDSMKFCSTVCWSMISSSLASFRLFYAGGLVEHASSGFYYPKIPLTYLVAFCNSSIVANFLEIISPTLNYEVSKIGKLPIRFGTSEETVQINSLSERCVAASCCDWNSQEVAWEFNRSPLV